VMSIGARNHPEGDVLRFVDIFLATPFSGDERHARRIAMLTEYEITGNIAGHSVF
jgi:ribose 5-phosphate isomerase B